MITIQAPQHAHTRIIIQYCTYMHFTHQATCGEQRFSWTLVQAPVIWIPLSYHIQKGNKVPVWLHRVQLKTSGREKHCWKGRRKNGVKCEGPWHCWTFFTVGDWHIVAPPITHRCCKTSDVILWLHSTPIIESSVLSEVLI